MKKLNLKSLTADITAVIYRFPVVLLYVLLFAVFAFLELNDKEFEKGFNIWGFIILSVFTSLSITLFLENISHRLVQILSFVVPLGALALYSFYFFDHKVEWEMMQYAAFQITSILTVFIVLFFRKKTDSSFWVFTEHIVREFIITMIYVSVMMGGLSLAIYAVDVLFNIRVDDDVYGNLAIACYLIIAPIYFLINIPPKDKLYTSVPDYGKFLKVLGLYVFLPVISIYLFILYMYLAKIILNWELPNGWVTTLVSVLALGGFLAKFLLFPISDNKIVSFLNRYFSVLLFPLIILMSIGLARRISDYGISINRLYVLIFNLWLYGVSIFLFITNSRCLKWLVISFVVILLLSSVGPWSVYSVTKSVVQNDIEELLTENKLLVDGKLVENKNNKLLINDSIAIRISEKVRYYFETFGQQNWNSTFKNNFKSNDSYDVLISLGVNNAVVKSTNNYINANLSENRVYDINGYNKVITNLSLQYNNKLIFSNSDNKIEFIDNVIVITDKVNEDKVSFPLQRIISELYVNNENQEIKNRVLIQKSGHCMLIINNLSAECKSSTDFKIQQLSFTLFTK